MSVALIGNFMYQTPDDNAIGSLDLLLSYFQIQRYVTVDFKLYAMCEARPTNSPGILLYYKLDTICQSLQSKLSYPYICQHLVNFSAILGHIECRRCGLLQSMTMSVCQSVCHAASRKHG